MQLWFRVHLKVKELLFCDMNHLDNKCVRCKNIWVYFLYILCRGTFKVFKITFDRIAWQIFLAFSFAKSK